MLRSARLVISRSNLSGQRMRSRTCLRGRSQGRDWGGGASFDTPPSPADGKLLDLSCLLIDLKKKDHGVAVMSIVIELLVLLGKKMFIV